MENINEEFVEIGDVINILLSSTDDEPENMVIKLVDIANNTDFNMTEISVNSPLGKSIYKKKIGEKIQYKVNDNTFNVTILNKVNNINKQKVLE